MEQARYVALTWKVVGRGLSSARIRVKGENRAHLSTVRREFDEFTRPIESRRP